MSTTDMIALGLAAALIVLYAPTVIAWVTSHLPAKAGTNSTVPSTTSTTTSTNPDIHAQVDAWLELHNSPQLKGDPLASSALDQVLGAVISKYEG